MLIRYRGLSGRLVLSWGGCLAFMCSLLLGVSSQAQTAFRDISISAAGDVFFPQYMVNGPSDPNRARIRTAELSLYGPLDPVVDARISIAGHDEAGQFEFELHEAFLDISRLAPRTRARLGKFFLHFGRLNGFHQHDWPFATTPPMTKQLFNTFEAASDTGVEVSHLMILEPAVEVTLGLTNGYHFGHTHSLGERPLTPTHYARVTAFFEPSSSTNQGLLVGLNSLARMDADAEMMRLTGLDATWKLREGRRLTGLIQGEVFHQMKQAFRAAVSERWAAYVFGQYGMDEQWSVGLRIDGFTEPTLRFGTGDKRANFNYGLQPQITYRSGEFSTLRLGYDRQTNTRQGDNDSVNDVVFLQWVFILGAHPAHPF